MEALMTELDVVEVEYQAQRLDVRKQFWRYRAMRDEPDVWTCSELSRARELILARLVEQQQYLSTLESVMEARMLSARQPWALIMFRFWMSRATWDLKLNVYWQQEVEADN
jgi:hypothetical protein